MDSITGTYSGYRGVGTVAVEESPAGMITVDVEHRNLVFTATPDDVAGGTYRFSQVLGDGRKWLVAFETAESPVELILTLGKWTSRLTKDGSEQ